MLDFNDFPIKSTVTASSLQDGNYIAKSGISFKNWKGDNVILGGYSYGADQESVLEKSRYEVLERLLAHFDFHKATQSWNGYNIFDPTESKIYCRNQILLGELPDIDWHQTVDSSGLSYHTDLESAVRHAVYELIERHILCEIWFSQSRKIKLISEEDLMAQDSRLQIYTTEDLPFALSFIYSQENAIVFAGSSFSDSLDISISKSRFEALMMFESWCAKTNVVCHSPNTKKRLEQLGNMNFYNFFNKIIKNNDAILEERSTLSFTDFIRYIYIVKIITKKSAFLVRAVSDNLLSLKKCRLEYKHMVPYDPFF